MFKIVLLSLAKEDLKYFLGKTKMEDGRILEEILGQIYKGFFQKFLKQFPNFDTWNFLKICQKSKKILDKF